MKRNFPKKGKYVDTIGFTMVGNVSEAKTRLLDEAISWLRQRMPSGWTVEAPADTVDLELIGDMGVEDVSISLKGPNGVGGSMAVEFKSELPPRYVREKLATQIKLARKMRAHLPLLVIAPWISQRSQEALAENGINYIDLTGNALIRIDNPPFYLYAEGSNRNPRPAEQGPVQLRGKKAARLLRLLIDVSPPYTAKDIAQATGLAPGYVSRALESLYRDSLIERPRRGPVEEVDLAAIVRRWAETYDVFRQNSARGYIARSGLGAVIEALPRASTSGEWAITGSFAAVRIAAIAAPSLLLIYSEYPERLAKTLDLLPADEGADVMLLAPFDRVVFTGCMEAGGDRYVAPAQVAVDCLTGNGRMPSEGEAVLKWMLANESDWRAPSLAKSKWAIGM